MPISAKALKPHEVLVAQGADFGTGWTLNGAWNVSIFDSLPKGKSTLWHHTPGAGRFPNHTGYEYTGAATVDDAVSPTVDLRPFANPDGSGQNNEQFWTVYVRIWFRPNKNPPVLSSVDQQPDRLKLIATASGGDIEIGTFSDFDNVIGAGQTVEDDYMFAKELSRIDATIPASVADATLDTTGVNPSDGETVTVGASTYTFKDSVDPKVANEIKIESTTALSLANLAAAINNDQTAGRFSLATTANASVTATSATNTITATAITEGAAANSVATTETLATGSWDSATLTGGSDASTDPNVGDNGEWWAEQILVPNLEQQALILGQLTTWTLSLQMAERDSSDYGTGIAKFSIEVIRDDAESNALARGGFGGLPPVQPDFPIELYRSWANSKRWR